MTRQDDGLFDLAVVGGGMVGGAIAYGTARRGARIFLLDEGDVAFRAARGNFGLVWAQSKGDKLPAYGIWSLRSAADWRNFAEELAPFCDGDVGYRHTGGLVFCLGEEEFEDRRALVLRQHNQDDPDTAIMVDRRELETLVPEAPLGPRVLGAAFAPGDGHTNPLRLLRSLAAGFRAHGGVHRPGPSVETIAADGDSFRIARPDGAWRARRVVVAAGVNTTSLAAQIGLDVPIHPVRGQNIVSERLRPLLRKPASALRQTLEGQIQIGVSHEEVGLDDRTSVSELARMAARACAVMPVLRGARMIRSWAALRPMTPDGFPVYAQSATHRGAFVAAFHSGVTLAPMHAGPLAEALLGDAMPEAFAPFHPDRFSGDHVRSTQA